MSYSFSFSCSSLNRTSACFKILNLSQGYRHESLLLPLGLGFFLYTNFDMVGEGLCMSRIPGLLASERIKRRYVLRDSPTSDIQARKPRLRHSLRLDVLRGPIISSHYPPIGDKENHLIGSRDDFMHAQEPCKLVEPELCLKCLVQQARGIKQRRPLRAKNDFQQSRDRSIS